MALWSSKYNEMYTNAKDANEKHKVWIKYTSAVKERDLRSDVVKEPKPSKPKHYGMTAAEKHDIISSKRKNRILRDREENLFGFLGTRF